MFERENRRAADQIREASQRLRELGRKATPGVWRIDHVDGQVLLASKEGQEVAVLTGLWAPATAEYLAVVAPAMAFHVAELMWLGESEVRRGELSSRLRDAMLAVAGQIPSGERKP